LLPKNFSESVSVLNRKNPLFPPSLACVATGLTLPPCSGFTRHCRLVRNGAVTFCQPTGKPAYNRIVGSLLYFILSFYSNANGVRFINLPTPANQCENEKARRLAGFVSIAKYRYFSLPRKFGS
jgi:hypothetical protein